METYKIVRFYRDSDDPRHQSIIKTGLTLAEAKEHCSSEETHEKDADGIAIWFDGFTQE